MNSSMTGVYPPIIICHSWFGINALFTSLSLSVFTLNLWYWSTVLSALLKSSILPKQCTKRNRNLLTTSMNYIVFKLVFCRKNRKKVFHQILTCLVPSQMYPICWHPDFLHLQPLRTAIEYVIVS